MRLAVVCLLSCIFLQCPLGFAESPRRLGAPAPAASQGRYLGDKAITLGDETSNTLPTVVSWILFGGVVMIMTVFYLVNYRDEDIKDATWLVLSNAISLFCAVLLFLSFRELIALITDGEEVRRLGAASDADWGQCWIAEDRRLTAAVFSRRLAGVPTQKTLAIDAICALILFALWETILFLIRKRRALLSALGLIAAHCIGFSSLFAFGNMQQCEPFRDSPGYSFVVVIVGSALLVLVFGIAHLVRRRVASAAGVDAHEAHNWFHQCTHSEREAFAFAVSYLLAQFFTYISISELAPLHHVPKGIDPGDAVAEFYVIAGLCMGVILSGFLENAIATYHGHHDLAHDSGHGHEMTRSQLSLHMIKDTLTFATGWSILELVKLCFWSATDDNGLIGEGDVMTSHVVIVFISSAMTFGIFFIIDFAADRMHGHVGRGLRALGKSLMLLLGLAWEGAFWEGAHAMSDGMGLAEKTSKMIMVILCSLSLCAVVMPAWIIYIVPQTYNVHDGEIHAKDYDDHASPASTPKGSITLSDAHSAAHLTTDAHSAGHLTHGGSMMTLAGGSPAGSAGPQPDSISPNCDKPPCQEEPPLVKIIGCAGTPNSLARETTGSKMSL